MTWFETLTGFPETSPSQVRQNLRVDRETITSLVNGKVMACGTLETPSLGQLRQRIATAKHSGSKLTLSEVVANVQDLHTNTANADALFQVASQFNLLEMPSQHVTPEQGISRYASDPTQGPACAVAAGAGTIYRNYFAPVAGQTGQSADNQIDCLADLGNALDNSGNRLWKMQNGYALATASGLKEIQQRLQQASEAEKDRLRALLRIGIQWRTQVTLKGCTHKVSQAYCSALPVGYSEHPRSLWEAFARLVLEASYEATLCAAIINLQANGSKRLFLTLLGGGVFRNERGWIVASLERALNLYQDWGLDVCMVSYRQPNPDIDGLLEKYQT